MSVAAFDAGPTGGVGAGVYTGTGTGWGTGTGTGVGTAVVADVCVSVVVTVDWSRVHELIKNVVTAAKAIVLIIITQSFNYPV